MATPVNVRAAAAPYDRDPLLGFKYIVSWDDGAGGDFTPVAGVSKIGALTRDTEVVLHSHGGESSTVTSRINGQTTYGELTLERGLIIEIAFERWANKVWFYENTGALGEEVSLSDFRKTLKIDLCNQAGQIAKVYYVFNCWPSAYTAAPDLDSNSNDIALESMTIQNEGWQRDDSYAAPDLPSYSHPEAPASS
ncbi:MAG: phage tail protein [bacterium]|nr:phage tail protein [bacterium]